MKLLKYLLWVVIALAGLFIVFLAFSTIDNYNPPASENILSADDPDILSDSTFTAVIWNIGYAGLDSTMDFFYDGGKKVRPDKEGVERNIKGIQYVLESFRETDFILLQEVDKGSKRSYHYDIYGTLEKQFNEYTSNFGKNYDVAFVPLPPKAPMGKVLSGLQTLTLSEPESVTRYSFPGNYSWPMSVFMLDRCFLLNRHPLAGGKELIIINTHNSAYDDGSLRKEQMDYLKNILVDEYRKGNYVLVGGDWNQCPPDFEPQLEPEVFDTDALIYIEEGYPEPGWSWAYDQTIPTNRRVLRPYKSGDSPTTVIDFFLLSPNIEILEVSGRDLDFAFSDHQPVHLTFKLN